MSCPRRGPRQWRWGPPPYRCANKLAAPSAPGWPAWLRLPAWLVLRVIGRRPAWRWTLRPAPSSLGGAKGETGHELLLQQNEDDQGRHGGHQRGRGDEGL